MVDIAENLNPPLEVNANNAGQSPTGEAYLASTSEAISVQETLLPADEVRPALEGALLNLTKLEKYSRPPTKEQLRKLQEEIASARTLVQGRLDGINGGDGLLPSVLNDVLDNTNRVLEEQTPHHIKIIEGSYAAWKDGKRESSRARELDGLVGAVLRHPEEGIAKDNPQLPPFLAAKLREMHDVLIKSR